MNPIFASKRGFATILAALRLYHTALETMDGLSPGGALWRIATDNGAFTPMTAAEVETMIQELQQ